MHDPIHGDKPHEWMSDAGCIGLPSSWFFPERGDPITDGSNYGQAKKVCRTQCPVAAECLEYALTPPLERIGIFGGLTARERGRLRGRRVV